MILRTAEAFGTEGIVMTTSQYDKNVNNNSNSGIVEAEMLDDDTDAAQLGTGLLSFFFLCFVFYFCILLFI